MAAFEYKALDVRGKTTKGVLEADNARQARQILREKSLIPVDIAATQEKEQQKSKQAFSFARGISTTELSLITRQLATLVQAAMPLEECLKAVAEQSEKPRLKNMMTAVRSKVVEGYTLSDSLADYPHIFDQLFRAMVAAGEKSGHLGPVLERLADYVENREQIRNKLIQAMVYPIVLIVVSIGIVAFLLASVVPEIVGNFTQTGQELPKVTQVLLAMSDFVTAWGWLVLLVTIAVFMFTKLALRSEKRRLGWDRSILGLPVIGRVARGLNTSRFARTLAICTSSAIPLLEGMKVASDVMTNTWVKSQVLEASERVREGASLRISLEKTKLFPPMMLHMIASGERSGELEPMLTRASDNQDRDFEAQVNIALAIFSPMLIVLMAGVVLFIVIATLMPIIALNSLVGA
ncbi:type II secretion system protein GspF [Veronia nyctiphanis]|uniref:General secretion pathway protein F n=1 Tax=Veronia nyctiphanis TaxID=1278244 RepID=A0A4Q0YU04_9GAMM|nr:type II secretion system inner membrane protein GspF [Veronia nyctiphanis]RXJ72659.1 type II secretion system protein GspF [Veronia nyctiphanis]